MAIEEGMGLEDRVIAEFQFLNDNGSEGEFSTTSKGACPQVNKSNLIQFESINLPYLNFGNSYMISPVGLHSSSPKVNTQLTLGVQDNPIPQRTILNPMAQPYEQKFSHQSVRQNVNSSYLNKRRCGRPRWTMLPPISPNRNPPMSSSGLDAISSMEHNRTQWGKSETQNSCGNG